MAVTLPMRPPFCRYSSVSTEKKGKVFRISQGTRRSVRVSQSMPRRMSSASCSTIMPVPRDPLMESYTRM